MASPCPTCGETVAVPRSQPPVAEPPPLQVSSAPVAKNPEEKKGFWTGGWSVLGMLLAAVIGKTVANTLFPKDKPPSALDRARASAWDQSPDVLFKPYVERPDFEARDSQSPPRDLAAPTPRPAWVRHHAMGLSLESPFALLPSKRFTREKLPAAVKEMVDDITGVEGGDGVNPLLVVIRGRYKPGMVLNLNGAIDEGMRSAAATLGDRNPQFTTEARMVDGVEARRGRWTGTVATKRVYLETLAFGRDQQMWQVMVIRQELTGFDVARLFDSIRVEER